MCWRYCCGSLKLACRRECQGSCDLPPSALCCCRNHLPSSRCIPQALPRLPIQGVKFPRDYPLTATCRFAQPASRLLYAEKICQTRSVFRSLKTGFPRSPSNPGSRQRDDPGPRCPIRVPLPVPEVLRNSDLVLVPPDVPAPGCQG